jgi:hypothetical protein
MEVDRVTQPGSIDAEDPVRLAKVRPGTPGSCPLTAPTTTPGNSSAVVRDDPQVSTA